MNKLEKQVYQEVADQQVCMLCFIEKGTECHHIRYGACGRKTYRGNVILLCKSCHDMVHSNKKRWQPKLICIIDSFIERNKV
jgi:hypothetical protein